MTDQHPLHPKLIDALSEYRTCDEAMRAAADWQLKQVIKALKFMAANIRAELRKLDAEPTTTQEKPND